jgi:hypothetical protein
VPEPEASLVEEIDRHARDAFDPDWIGKDPPRTTPSRRRSCTTTVTRRPPGDGAEDVIDALAG